MKRTLTNSPFTIFVFLISINISTLLFRRILIKRPPSFIREARECLHSYIYPLETDDQFFSRMWPTLHQIVDKCSTRHFRHRLRRFGSGRQSFQWLEWLVDEPTHLCNGIFAHNSTSLETEQQFKLATIKCSVYSISDKHMEPERFQDPRYSIMTIKQKINPKPKRMSWGVDHYARDADAFDLVYFLMVQVHKLRHDSINMFYDGNHHIKLLYSKSSFDDANLITCQFNIIYDRPKTRLGRREFRSSWKRLLYDRRYLVASVRKLNKDTFSMFIINISDPYCWAKYVSNEVFNLRNT